MTEEVINSSSSSCYGSDETWQEIGRTCGSMLRLIECRPSFRMCTASLIHLVPLRLSIQDGGFQPVRLHGCHGLH